MINPKHDRQGVRRASDIEQKYNLAGIKGLEQEGAQQKRDLSNLNQLFSQFSSDISSRLNRLENLVFKIGSIYTTLTQDDPSELFGGEWQLIAEGRVLVGHDSESELPQVFQGNDKCYIWKRIA